MKKEYYSNESGTDSATPATPTIDSRMYDEPLKCLLEYIEYANRCSEENVQIMAYYTWKCVKY